MITNKYDDIFFKNIPQIDLHGLDRESARVMTNDFIDEAVYMKYDKIVIIHGIGTGILKTTVHETLSKNKNVSSYKIDGRNIGCTIVNIKRRE